MCFALGERCCCGKVLNWEWAGQGGEEQAGSARSLLPLPSPADVAVTAATMQPCVVPDCLPLFCPRRIRADSWFRLLSADLSGGFGCQYPSKSVGTGSSPSPPQQPRWWMLHHASPVLSSTAAGISAELLWVSGNHMLKCYPACLWGVSYQLVSVNSVQTITNESLPA